MYEMKQRAGMTLVGVIALVLAASAFTSAWADDTVLAAGPAVAVPPSATVQAPPSAPSNNDSVPLIAHRASYNVTLLSSTGSKSPTSARGRVAYEFSGSSCEGYTQTFRQITELQPAEGATRLSDMHSATFEDGEAHNFSFNVTTSTDSNSKDVIDGHAAKKPSELAIQISKPSHQTITVDQEVLFPTEHLKHIIMAARGGKNLFSAKVFDGSDDGKKVYETTAVIGHQLLGPAGDAAKSNVLDNVPRWPVSISYYEEDKKDEGPAYILGFELYDNGVSRALRFDYGDFVLGGELTSLDVLPAKSCGK